MIFNNYTIYKKLLFNQYHLHKDLILLEDLYITKTQSRAVFKVVVNYPFWFLYERIKLFDYLIGKIVRKEFKDGKHIYFIEPLTDIPMNVFWAFSRNLPISYIS